MNLPRRTILSLAAGAAALPALSRLASAQMYPSRPVHWIVPFPPGGGTDIVARLMGQWLSERLGQPFIIENRPGAGTNIGTEAVVRAPPDGYTLLLVASVNAINATLYDKLSFNFIRDIAAAPTARCKNVRRGSFIAAPPSPALAQQPRRRSLPVLRGGQRGCRGSSSCRGAHGRAPYRGSRAPAP